MQAEYNAARRQLPEVRAKEVWNLRPPAVTLPGFDTAWQGESPVLQGERWCSPATQLDPRLLFPHTRAGRQTSANRPDSPSSKAGWQPSTVARLGSNGKSPRPCVPRQWPPGRTRRKGKPKRSRTLKLPTCTDSHPPGRVAAQYCTTGWLKRVVPPPVQAKQQAIYRNSTEGKAKQVSDIASHPHSPGFTIPGRVHAQSCNTA